MSAEASREVTANAVGPDNRMMKPFDAQFGIDQGTDGQICCTAPGAR